MSKDTKFTTAPPTALLDWSHLTRSYTRLRSLFRTCTRKHTRVLSNFNRDLNSCSKLYGFRIFDRRRAERLSAGDWRTIHESTEVPKKWCAYRGWWFCAWWTVNHVYTDCSEKGSWVIFHFTIIEIISDRRSIPWICFGPNIEGPYNEWKKDIGTYGVLTSN